MRNFLDKLYALSGAIAATFILSICIVVLLQVGANMISTFIQAVTGKPYGLAIPSYSEFTGYFLVGATFFALASSLRHGAHIRVTLIIGALRSNIRRFSEIMACLVGLGFSTFFAWYSILMVMNSFKFNDLSAGILPIPTWIPQVSMPLGLIVLSIALADTLIELLRGQRPDFLDSEEETLAASNSKAIAENGEKE